MANCDREASRVRVSSSPPATRGHPNNAASAFGVTTSFLCLKRFRWRALLDPLGPATVDMGNVGHAHVLQGFGGQCTAPARAAEQNELLGLIAEQRLEVR